MSEPQAQASGQSQPPLQSETVTSELVTAGIRHFEHLIGLVLSRSPATTAVERENWGAVQRYIAVEVLRSAALAMIAVEQRDLVTALRLFDDEFCGISTSIEHEPLAMVPAAPEELGELLESLLALTAQQKAGKLSFLPSKQRKQRGIFYTPRAVVRSVVDTALRPWLFSATALPRICDPALGGGAFLIGAARALADASAPDGALASPREHAIVVQLHGFDIEPLAVAVAEAALLIWSRGGPDELAQLKLQLREVDALEQRQAGPYDLVIGNPPWVAYAGRATQPLSEARRSWLAKNYAAFRGYPTLQACFVELAAELTPKGRVALLVPSPLADLDGYRPMRRTLTRTHRVNAELIEYGQDAFEGVTQPCFGLIADADPGASESDATFSLVERSGAATAAARVEVPECFARLAELPRLPADCFREFGFQTTSEVTRSMLLRGDAPQPPFEYPLLEGRDVAEFTVGKPRLYLNADREKLRQLRCRLRGIEEYQAVQFVVRQTAAITIAALHSGMPFRNSLIAGFGEAQYSAAVLVGLLNSTLYRAMHLAGQRDARQKTFPQVKVAHLRGLPAPPPGEGTIAHDLEALVHEVTGHKPTAVERHRLDALVYRWFAIADRDATSVDGFYAERIK